MNDEIPDLDLLLKVKIGTHVLYACQFWALHLRYADRSDELHEALSVFVTTKLPYWLEVLSLSRHLDHAQTSLKIAQAWYNPEEEEPKRLAVLQKMIPILEPLQIFNEALSSAEGKLLQAKAPIKVLLSDCQSLLLHFRKSITKSACHIYHSALGLAPDCLLYRQYQKEIEHSVSVMARGNAWDSLITIYREHFRRITTVCFSPNGLKIAFASVRVIYLCDSITGITIRELTGHTQEVSSLSFSPDGFIIASGSYDSTVRVWDSVTGAQTHILQRHLGAVHSVCFSNGGHFIVSGSHDGVIHIWDSVTGAHIRQIDTQGGAVFSLSFSPKRSYIASGSQSTTVHLWDSDTGVCVKQLQGHTQPVNTVCFSPNGLTIASGSWDTDVCLWDCKSGALIKTLRGHSGRVNSVCFSPDGMSIASASADKTIHLWSVDTGFTIKILKGSPDAVDSACFSPDGLKIASGSGDNMLHIWDTTANQMLQSKAPKGHSAAVRSVCFSRDGTKVASGSDDLTVRLWEFSTAKLINTFKGHHFAVDFVGFPADGRLITSYDIQESIICWNLKTSKKANIPGVETVPDLLGWLWDSRGKALTDIEGSLSLSQESVVFTHPDKSQHTLCILPYSDISCHAVSGYAVAVGTETGKVHFLDFSQAVTLVS
ncbi:POC1 centriolar protein A [Tulasnella sp. 418]|nr:POC1 centriolar protein A [Tulasnella sp. 418]